MYENRGSVDRRNYHEEKQMKKYDFIIDEFKIYWE